MTRMISAPCTNNICTVGLSQDQDQSDEWNSFNQFWAKIWNLSALIFLGQSIAWIAIEIPLMIDSGTPRPAH